MAIAGIIAFMIYYCYRTDMGFWSVVTIAAITQSTNHDTLVKMIMRSAGTLIGAFVGFVGAHIAHQTPYILMPLILACITATSFISLQKTPYSYGGTVAGMTISIILFFSTVESNINNIVIDRTIEILIGVLILSILNIIIITFEKNLISTIKHTSITLKQKTPKLKPAYLFPAIKVATACLISFLIWYYFKLPQGYWAALTCLLIMEEESGLTFKKGMMRLGAHLIAVTISLGIAIALSHVNFAWYIIPLFIIFFLCGYLISMESEFSSMGNTIGIATSVMLIANTHLNTTQHLIYARFYNVVLGLIIAFSALSISTNSIKSIFSRN